MAIVDDNYSIGPPETIFAAQPQFAADLAEVGLQLQSDKSKCYIASQYRNEEWDTLRGEIQNGVLKSTSGEVIMNDGSPLFGITTCNVPVGSRDFVEGYLNQQLERIEKGNRKIKSLLDPGRWPHPEIPTRQMLWILTLFAATVNTGVIIGYIMSALIGLSIFLGASTMAFDHCSKRVLVLI